LSNSKNAGPCRRDEELYFKVRESLERLLDLAHLVLDRAEEKKQRRAAAIARHVASETSILIEQLAAWQPEDRICYDEFISRIRRHYSVLRAAAKRLGVELPRV